MPKFIVQKGARILAPNPGEGPAHKTHVEGESIELNEKDAALFIAQGLVLGVAEHAEALKADAEAKKSAAAESLKAASAAAKAADAEIAALEKGAGSKKGAK